MLQLFFCKRFRKTDNFRQNFAFLKFLSEIHKLVWKRSQKINMDVILHYVSFPTYPLLFPKVKPIQKQ